MPRADARLSEVLAALQSDAKDPGALERVVGLNTATTTIKCVHLMNDLAQQVVGGAPDHRGDFLCRVIRQDHDGSSADDDEDNSDRAMREDERFGDAYRAAFPPALGVRRTAAAREAAELLLNFDGGIYRAGDAMASGLASHWTLLGHEGFCRFGLGGALAAAIGHEGRAQVRALFTTDHDPVSRAVRPLMLEGDLVERRSGRGPVAASALDQVMGPRITQLLRHPLAKPARLRGLGLAGGIWAVLRVLGAGREGGRPLMLAIPSQWSALGSRLREPAVQSFAFAVAALDKAVAAELAKLPTLGLTIHDAEDALRTLRDQRDARRGRRVYWPDAFAVALGRKIGCVGPLTNKFGWGKYLSLTPDLLETLLMMFVDPGGAPRPWRSVWDDIRSELGVVIGAAPHEDEGLLHEAGLHHVSLDDLENNADLFLEQACRRGIARRLPDGDAEAGAAID